MAKITNKTRVKGTIQTATQGTLEFHIKKPFKGALNYVLFIDGRNTGNQGLLIEDVKEQLLNYVKGW